MRNIRLTIQYDGTNYSGWQFQKNAESIQEVIERTIRTITGERSRLTGASRTDAGAHARMQVANFKTRSDIPLDRLGMALNSRLPEDVVVSDIAEADLGFDSQRSARSKLYRYTIACGNFIDPFARRFAAKCFYRLDIAAMKRAGAFLVGRHDFRAFQTKDGQETKSVRTVKKIKIEKIKNFIYIDIEADGFLYNMVRNIVGTLIEVGRGKIAIKDVKDILLKKDRRLSGPKMPAKGLSLVKVKY